MKLLKSRFSDFSEIREFSVTLEVKQHSKMLISLVLHLQSTLASNSSRFENNYFNYVILADDVILEIACGHSPDADPVVHELADEIGVRKPRYAQT